MTERTPCDDCRFDRLCAKEKLACEAYARYVGSHSGYWPEDAERSPSRGQYLRLARDEFAPPAQKTTCEDKRLMRALRAEGMSTREIAEKFEVSQGLVQNVMKEDA